jgi:hypothetical protein
MSVRGNAAVRLGRLGGGLLLLRPLCDLRGMGLRGKVLSARDYRHNQKRKDRKRKSGNQRLKKSLPPHVRRRWLGIHRLWPWLHHLLHCNLLPAERRHNEQIICCRATVKNVIVLSSCMNFFAHTHRSAPDKWKRGAALQGINECIASND